MEIGAGRSEAPSVSLVEKWKHKLPAEKIHYGLMASFVLLNVADALTTGGFLRLGGHELNPTMRAQIAFFGPDFALASKVVLGSALTLFSMESAKRGLDRLGVKRSTVLPDIPLTVLNAAILGAVINNVLLIDRLSKG